MIFTIFFVASFVFLIGSLLFLFETLWKEYAEWKERRRVVSAWLETEKPSQDAIFEVAKAITVDHVFMGHVLRLGMMLIGLLVLSAISNGMIGLMMSK